jgi:hypothetical protein
LSFSVQFLERLGNAAQAGIGNDPTATLLRPRVHWSAQATIVESRVEPELVDKRSGVHFLQITKGLKHEKANHNDCSERSAGDGMQPEY